MVIWFIFLHFGILCQEKSGNPDTNHELGPRVKIQYTKHNGPLAALAPRTQEPLFAPEQVLPVNLLAETDSLNWFQEELALLEAWYRTKRWCLAT
jgi:hypothetical protein